ncbi:hypothetical protein D3C78_1414070 [compost metagenome]
MPIKLPQVIGQLRRIITELFPEKLRQHFQAVGFRQLADRIKHGANSPHRVRGHRHFKFFGINPQNIQRLGKLVALHAGDGQLAHHRIGGAGGKLPLSTE